VPKDSGVRATWVSLVRKWCVADEGLGRAAPRRSPTSDTSMAAGLSLERVCCVREGTGRVLSVSGEEFLALRWLGSAMSA